MEKKYYFITYYQETVHRAGAPFSTVLTLNSLIDVHPFTWQIDCRTEKYDFYTFNNTLLNYKEITKEEYDFYAETFNEY